MIGVGGEEKIEYVARLTGTIWNASRAMNELGKIVSVREGMSPMATIICVG
jgi:hypothetical protein